MPEMINLRSTSLHRLFRPIDIASLAVFRIAFGAILTWEAFRYLVPREPDGVPWARQFYVEPLFLFRYYGFGWVHPWPGGGMIWHFWAWAIAAMCVAVGFCYRASAVVLCALIGHVFLLDQARYLNHMYLIWLLSFLLIFLPLNRAGSVDATHAPALRSDVVPAWTLWLLRFQVGIVYVFSGIARANGDWVRGEPMRMWLRDRAASSMFSPVLASEWAPYAFSVGGMLFDLLIVPLLLWRRTRTVAFCAAIGFHLTNAYVFRIGVFPWLGIAATTLFLDPGWPRRAWAVGERFRRERWGWVNTADEAAAPGAEIAVKGSAKSLVVVVAVAGYVAVQLLVPLRHLLYPGNVNWTHEGHYFSWRMKLDNRFARVRFFVTHPSTGERQDVNLDAFLDRRQKQLMAARPDMIVQFAQHISHHYREAFTVGEDPPVHALVSMSLNGRPMKPLIDPAVNLASRRVSMRPADWIVRQPLEPIDSHRAHASRMGE